MKKFRNRILLTIAVFFAFLFLIVCAPAAETVRSLSEAKKASVAIDDITLPVPDNEAEKKYLGLSESGEFKLDGIESQVVLINVFSTTCPHCQKEALNTNLLYDTIENDPGLKDKIKILGIGYRDSREDLDRFKEEYEVSFPLFPDEDMSISNLLQVRGTPTMFGVKADENGDLEIIFSKVGSIGEVPWFIDFLLDISGLK